VFDRLPSIFSNSVLVQQNQGITRKSALSQNPRGQQPRVGAPNYSLVFGPPAPLRFLIEAAFLLIVGEVFLSSCVAGRGRRIALTFPVFPPPQKN
jgi:hypothetical protein